MELRLERISFQESRLAFPPVWVEVVGVWLLVRFLATAEGVVVDDAAAAAAVLERLGSVVVVALPPGIVLHYAPFWQLVVVVGEAEEVAVCLPGPMLLSPPRWNSNMPEVPILELQLVASVFLDRSLCSS
jgi:hypothetical protein